MGTCCCSRESQSWEAPYVQQGNLSVAQAAGMKYIVLTTKHHDGFCLWDTKLTDFNILRSPFRRDVVKETEAIVARICRPPQHVLIQYHGT